MKWQAVCVAFCSVLALATFGHADEAAKEAKGQRAKPDSLKSLLTVTDIPLPAAINLGSTDYGTADWYQQAHVNGVIASVEPSGEVKVAWMDAAGEIHITPLSKSLERKGKDILLSGRRCRDMIALDDGAAALILKHGGMYLTRVSEKGDIKIDQRLIGLGSHDLHQGRIAYDGKTFGAYFGVEKNFGRRRGVHQGDALITVTNDGEMTTHWSWGCSHAIDLRLRWVGGKMIPLCLTDAYPSPGMWFNHTETHVTTEAGSTNGYVSGRFGGMVEVGGHMIAAFTSERLGRWEAGLAAFGKTKPHARLTPIWLTDTPDVIEADIKIANYGNQLLISWMDLNTGKRSFRLFDFKAVKSDDEQYEDGMKVERIGRAETLPVTIGPLDDFKSLPNGDVIWATAKDGATKLQVVTIAAE